MLHASSNNHSRTVRFMTNPPVVLKDPLNFNRANRDEFSLIELATLHGLGVRALRFPPDRAARGAVGNHRLTEAD